MTTEFNQKRGANSRKFILTSDKVIVETKTLQKNNKYEVKLDSLGLDIHYQSDNTLPGKIFLGVCVVIAIISVLSFFFSKEKDAGTWIISAVIFTSLALIGYFKQNQDDIYLVGGHTDLVFYRNIPSEKEVLEFIDKIKVQVKNYLKEKYTIFDDLTSEQEFYDRISWLYDKEIISRAEYIEFKTRFNTHRLL